MRSNGRPSSSAETSIDEDTADQLFADDFSVPSSPVVARSGTMAFARPTSSAFGSQQRSPSLSSSLDPALPPPARHMSISTNDRDSRPSSIVPGSGAILANVAANEPRIDPILASESNPFTDPSELVSTSHEKQADVLAVNSAEKPRQHKWGRKRLLIGIIALLLVLLIVLLPVGLLVIKPKHASNSSSSSTDGVTAPDGRSPASLGIPASAEGTVLDSTKWLDWTDFNVTYTSATVGGLSLMGLNSSWDDSAQANSKVPVLSSAFPYGRQPIKGISVGGWLVLEPYITPSIFSQYPLSLGIVDEYTLSKHLGRQQAASELENHYATFVTQETFQDIHDAGFDHVRISFPYWAITNIDPNDPYVEKTCWRYLLRGIEWARALGLRINLVLHAAPGSQNGWNHRYGLFDVTNKSGRQGVIGTDGDLNGQRTINFTTQLTTFFSQPRYKNIVTMYSILNEPNMIRLGADVVNNWSKQAYTAARNAGYNGSLIISDGFLPTADFIGSFPQADYAGLTMDIHDYVIFNAGNLAQTHQAKIGLYAPKYKANLSACVAVAPLCPTVDLLVVRSDETEFGGPTIVGEWSIADTDCALYVNSVGSGSRWEGTYSGVVGTSNVGIPGCATGSNCSCASANANASDYGEGYKNFLKDFFIAQTTSFENSWGWTWDTENATQWSYKKLLAAGIVSLDQAVDNFNCTSPLPDYQALGLPETF